MVRKWQLFLLFILLLALVACGGESEEASPLAEATAPPAEVAVEPTAPPAEAAVEPTAPPAEAAVEATAAPAEEPTAVPAAAPVLPRVGLLRFLDNDTSRHGSFQLLLQGVSPAPTGTHYELWLKDDAANTLNLGTIPADLAAPFTGETAVNLLALYSGAFISIEPDGASDGEIGTIAYNGVIPADPLVHVRHVAVAFPSNPNSNGFLIGADEQSLLALEHAGLLKDALTANDLKEGQKHAEHVVNILDGETGATFGDLDGDGVEQNPGDGLGVRAYFIGAKDHAQLAVDAAGATDEIRLHAPHIIISSDNALARLDASIAQAVRVVSSDSAAEAQAAADELVVLLTTLRDGVDVNGDGAIAPVVDEGGLFTAYEHAQNMGAFEFFPADGTVVAAPPADAGAGAAPVTGPVAIEMSNFTFQSGTITVPKGTTVTWSNQDQGVRHSATAADGSFDTGLFDFNQQGSVTFDTPGAFLYYCLLHGAPDGSGMTATITVTDDQAAAPPPPAAAPAAVSMVDFSFDQPALTVPVGTAVTWSNNGTKRHSATADDGSFNTQLFDPGQNATVTFDTPGTFAYYCELHGGPGGEGMAATITVTGDQTAAPPPEPPPAAPAAVSMVDFNYDQPALTVPVGTAVTWTNNGTKRHSATADDNSFNTQLFDPGKSATITFDKPGTFAYYCELHGGPGAQGMSATITVTP